MKQINYSWAAGFFDGEGHVRAWLDGRNWLDICLSASNTDKKTILRFKTIVGQGQIFLRKTKTRPIWIWSASTQQGAKVARLLYPFSITKRKQLRLYIQLAEKTRGKRKRGLITPKLTEWRQKIIKQISELKWT